MKKKTIVISAKCSDMFWAQLNDSDGYVVGEEVNGYVPEGLEIQGDSDDYVSFELDVETGKLVGYRKPSEETLKKIFKY